MSPSYKIRAATFTLLVVLAAGGVAMATSSGRPPERDPVPPGASVPARADRVDSALSGRFEVLRRARDRRDEIPDEARSTKVIPVIERDGLRVEALGLSQVERRFGLNTALARRARNTSPKVPAYVIPGAGTLCLAGGDVGVSCVADERAGAAFDSAVCGTVPSGKVAVYGLVADGAREVAVELRDGTRIPQAVEGNLLYSETENPSPGTVPVAVTWRSADGPGSARVPEQEPGVVCNTG